MTKWRFLLIGISISFFRSVRRSRAPQRTGAPRKRLARQRPVQVGHPLIGRGQADRSNPSAPQDDPARAIPGYQHDGVAVTKPGDLWILGRHKLLCGDARETSAHAALLVDEAVDLICTDPRIGPEDPIKSLAIEEAYRLITVREGDRVERIPVIQAILRKVAVAAANGNVRAQQQILSR
jgi:hypothetical protein